MSGVRGKLKRQRTAVLVQDFGLGEHLRHPVSKLSGGLRRRLNICVSLFRDPEILFMDEPTANVDSKTTGEILRVLGQMKAEGKTIVYITHLLEEAEKIADYVLKLENGKMVFFGPATEFFSKNNGQIS